MQPFHRVRLHRAIEYLTAGFPGALGAIHGNFGIAQNILSLRTAPAEDDTNACADHNLSAIHRERHRDPLPNALRHADRIARVAQFRRQHNKFVASRPGKGVVTRRAWQVAVRTA